MGFAFGNATCEGLMETVDFVFIVSLLGDSTFIKLKNLLIFLQYFSRCRLPDDYERLYQRIEAYSRTTRT